MLKNKEIRRHVAIQFVILLVGLSMMNRRNEFGIWWLFGCGVLLIGTNILYTRKRYQNLKHLTEYMHGIQMGKETLDIRDNEEGELSILKNEVYKLSIKLLHQAELLEQEKRFLADSMSDISHQLKTPITSMMMMADLLEEEALPEERRREFVQNIQVGLERMQWLVQALLKLAKLDAGATHMKKEQVFVQQVIQKAVQPLLIPMERKEQDFIVEGEEASYFLGDEAWMVEAISNILKNCMEHTPQGGTVKVQYSQNKLYTSITIQDNGSGIDREELAHIFERFYKGKNSSSDSVGIGLALSKMIIMEQRGTISVESRLDEGTLFQIKLYQK